jgi:hypothetical protein
VAAKKASRRRRRPETKSRRLVRAASSEVEANEPEIVGHTRRKFGPKRAERQKTAIKLDKARRRGAKIPKRRRTG